MNFSCESLNCFMAPFDFAILPVMREQKSNRRKREFHLSENEVDPQHPKEKTPQRSHNSKLLQKLALLHTMEPMTLQVVINYIVHGFDLPPSKVRFRIPAHPL